MAMAVAQPLSQCSHHLWWPWQWLNHYHNALIIFDGHGSGSTTITMLSSSLVAMAVAQPLSQCSHL